VAVVSVEEADGVEDVKDDFCQLLSQSTDFSDYHRLFKTF
jgi:hypothetical protein